MHTPPDAIAEAEGGRATPWWRVRAAGVDALRIADALVVAYLVVFLVVPLGAMLVDSAILVGRGGLGDLPGFGTYLIRLTRNSVVVASSATALAIGLAIPLALLTARVLPGGTLLGVGLTMPLLAPPFVSAFATIILFGRVGVVTQLLAMIGVRLPEIYGLPGIVITHVMHLTPLAYLTIVAGLRTVPKTIEESAVSLGSSPVQAITRVVLPYLASYIYMAALLVFLASFGDVGAPLIVGGQYLVLPTEAFTRFISFTADRRVPVLLSSWIVLISVVMLVGVRALMRRTAIAHTFSASVYAYDAPRWRTMGSAAGWLVAAVLLVPYLTILVSSFATVWGPALLPRALTLEHYQALWRSIGPLRNSLIVTAAATPIAVLLAVGVGRMVRSGGRLAAALDYVTLLPFVVSGIVLGIGLIRVYAPLEATPIGMPLLAGPSLLIIALASRRLSYPVRVMNAAYTRIDRSLEECSLSLGASPAVTFARITLPQLYPAILAALTITFIEVVKELGVTLIVHRPGWATLPVQIYGYAVEGNLGRAGAVSMVLLLLVGAGTVAANRLTARHARYEAFS
jgi:iron(III) transport system permease protein